MLQGFGRTCPAPLRRGVSEGDKGVIVSLHNKLRSQVALGQESRGLPGPQPPAADMLEMVWDDELAIVAQRWADQCQFGHDSIRDVSRFKVGQNVYIHAHTNDGPVPWRQGIMTFYDEVKLHNNRDTQSYRSVTEKNNILSQIANDKFKIQLCSITSTAVKNSIFYRFLSSTGHYTQMVWARTSKIGCGSISWREGAFIKQYMVCNYGPAGNTLRRPMYQIGNACSKCPRGTSCSNGLCSANGGGSSAALFPAAAQPPPSISVSIEPTRRPSRPIITQPGLEFGFSPMIHQTLQDPRPIQQPLLAIQSEPVNNDISVQNLLQPIQNILPNPPPPAVFLQQSPIQRPNLSSTRPQGPQRRPRNCRGMFAFMCRLLG